MRTTITGVTVFDGHDVLSGQFDVSFDKSGITGLNPAGTTTPTGEITDGTGATLLPGLIDSHVHFRDPAELSTLAQYGVTTALDMGSWPARFTAALRTAEHGADIRSAGTPLIGPAGPHSRIPSFPAEDQITTPEQARRRVAARVEEGVDYVKLVLERPGGGGPDLETAEAAVEAAHAAGLHVVAHASHTGAIALAVQAGVDILTHAPLDADLDEVQVRAIAEQGRVLVPTLTMMRGTARHHGDPEKAYAHARNMVTAVHRAGGTIVAGTDANTQPGVPAAVPHGSSLHAELGHLVEAGLTPREALRSATSGAATAFRLADRGSVRPGLRADLFLIAGDPLSAIDATRSIRAVWTAGRAVEVVAQDTPALP
ncbi:amidohydrolase family protein [Streptomyces sp. NPDC003781]|uniref:amidohydrolase family protein n=1 Tax=Streptomyces sp. NPDC003781 TaxID=3364686 RepID=UPI00368D0CCE